jgi:hypothetical protein
VIFFYNFYTKRFSFEKKRLLDNYREYFKKWKKNPPSKKVVLILAHRAI